MLNSVLEVFADCPGAGREYSKVPLLVMYSSELEDRHLGFWYRSRRGKVQFHPTYPLLAYYSKLGLVFSCAALENYCRNSPVSQIFWMKMDMAAFSSVIFPESVVTQVATSGDGRVPVGGCRCALSLYCNDNVSFAVHSSRRTSSAWRWHPLPSPPSPTLLSGNMLSKV